jgi:hypothetical protein
MGAVTYFDKYRMATFDPWISFLLRQYLLDSFWLEFFGTCRQTKMGLSVSNPKNLVTLLIKRHWYEMLLSPRARMKEKHHL